LNPLTNKVLVYSSQNPKCDIMLKGGYVRLNPCFMQRAIDEAKMGMERGGGPFGACIVEQSTGRILSSESNSVVLTPSPTKHAEINAIDAAAYIQMQEGMNTPYDLSGTVLYSTTKPCLMCQGAIIWARIPLVVYGTDNLDAQNAGFSEIGLSDHDHVFEATRFEQNLIIIKGFLRDDCIALFEQYMGMKGTIY
jgi:guanine deaminase